MSKFSEHQQSWNAALEKYSEQRAAAEAEIAPLSRKVKAAEDEVAKLGFLQRAFAKVTEVRPLKSQLNKKQKMLTNLDSELSVKGQRIMASLRQDVSQNPQNLRDVQALEQIWRKLDNIANNVERAINVAADAARWENSALITDNMMVDTNSFLRTKNAFGVIRNAAQQVNSLKDIVKQDAVAISDAALLSANFQNLAGFSMEFAHTGGSGQLNANNIRSLNAAIDTLKSANNKIRSSMTDIRASQQKVNSSAFDLARKANPELDALCNSIEKKKPAPVRGNSGQKPKR